MVNERGSRYFIEHLPYTQQIFANNMLFALRYTQRETKNIIMLGISDQCFRRFIANKALYQRSNNLYH